VHPTRPKDGKLIARVSGGGVVGQGVLPERSTGPGRTRSATSGRRRTSSGTPSWWTRWPCTSRASAGTSRP